jgi:hypothetical protein
MLADVTEGTCSHGTDRDLGFLEAEDQEWNGTYEKQMGGCLFSKI